MRIDILTIFPEYLAPLSLSLIGRARERGLLDVGVHDLRRWTSDVHRTVDDTPYGGGPGMVMRPEPWGLALDELVPAGQAVLTRAGEWVRYSAGPDGADYVAVCVPAFAPEAAYRDDEGNPGAPAGH